MSSRVAAAAPRGSLALLCGALLLAGGCLEPMPVFGAPCDVDEDCGGLGVCFAGACVPKGFPGLPDDNEDEDAGRPGADGGDDAGGEEPDAGGTDAGALWDSGDDDGGDEDAGDDDAGVAMDGGALDEDAGFIDAGVDAGPPPVCGDGVVEGGEECDWGDGRNGAPAILCSSQCAFDLSSPRRVNLDPLGGELSGQTFGRARISANGRYVVYTTDARDVLNAATEGRDTIPRLALLDLATGTTVLITGGADASVSAASISADGEIVVFASNATNLTPDADTNSGLDIYAYRRSTSEITLLSKSPITGAAANATSSHPWVDAAGTTVVFMSSATDLVSGTPSRSEIFRVSLDDPGQLEHVSTNESGGHLNERSENPVLSGDGATIAFYMYATDFFGPDTNGAPDTVFIDEQQRGYVSRLSTAVEANGASYVESISHSGDLITFRTTASNLGGAFQQSVLFDKTTSQLHRITWSAGQSPNANSTNSFVSGGGQYVVFTSGATNLVTGDTDIVDVFVRRVQGFSTEGLPTRVTSYNQAAGPPSMPHDGSVILFTSLASNIVPNDANGFLDVFLVRNPLYP